MASSTTLEEFLKSITGMTLAKGDMVFKDQSTGTKVKITVQDGKKRSLFSFGKKKEKMKEIEPKESAAETTYQAVDEVYGYDYIQVPDPPTYANSCSPGSEDNSLSDEDDYQRDSSETYENLRRMSSSNGIPPSPLLPPPLPPRRLVSDCTRDATISSSPVSDDSSLSGEDDYQRESEIYYNILRRRSSTKGTRSPDLPLPPVSARPVPAPRSNKNKPKSVLNDSESDIYGSMYTDIPSIAEIK